MADESNFKNKFCYWNQNSVPWKTVKSALNIFFTAKAKKVFDDVFKLAE